MNDNFVLYVHRRMYVKELLASVKQTAADRSFPGHKAEVISLHTSHPLMEVNGRTPLVDVLYVCQRRRSFEKQQTFLLYLDLVENLHMSVASATKASVWTLASDSTTHTRSTVLPTSDWRRRKSREQITGTRPVLVTLIALPMTRSWNLRIIRLFLVTLFMQFVLIVFSCRVHWYKCLFTITIYAKVLSNIVQYSIHCFLFVSNFTIFVLYSVLDFCDTLLIMWPIWSIWNETW